MAVPAHDEGPRAVPTGLPSRGSTVLDHVIRPFRRTGRYYARSWQDYLEHPRDVLPVARPTLALAAQAFRDEIVLSGIRILQPLGNQGQFERINGEVRAAIEFYGRQGCLAEPEEFFEAPPPLTDLKVRPVESYGRSFERVVFDSGYEPKVGEPGRERWLGYSANNRGYALLLRHQEPRPWLVCVHGAMMGRGRLDLALFRAWHLYEDLGLNLVLPVLPMHGPRGRGLPAGAVFPGQDVLDNVHATAQAVWDIRRLLSWIRAQETESSIGMNSISLGGYITSVVASLEDCLTCAILGVPVADMTELLGRHAGMKHNDPRRETVNLAAPLGRMVSPLSLTPRVPFRGRFIYAGIADQLVHPREQVVRLWEHWGRPEIVWYQGGHTGFFESRPVQQFVDAALLQSGLINS